MSAAPRTIQATPDMRPIAAVLGALVVAITLVVALAFGQQAATQSSTTPAAGAAPIAHDHGWSSAAGALTAPVTFDRGWATAPSTVTGGNRGSHGNAGKAGTGSGSSVTRGSNGARLAQ